METHQLELLNGNLLGTQAAIRALINLQPDPHHAAAAVALELELCLAKGLASEHSNDWLLRGVESAKRAVLGPPPAPRPSQPGSA